MLARITNERCVLPEKSLIAIDVSGSIETEFLDRVLQSIKEDIKPCMSFCTFDNQILNFSTNLNQLLESQKVLAGGGSDVNSLMNFAKENNFTNIVIITDGMLPSFDYLEGIDLTWILYEANEYTMNLKGSKFVALKP